MWTWDSTEIDFSQTCWTFDGYDGCRGKSNKGVIYEEGYLTRTRKIKEEDEEIAMFIMKLLENDML